MIMKMEFIPKFVMLLAGTVVCAVLIFKQVILGEKDITSDLAILLGVLLVFYWIGCLVRKLLEKIIQHTPSKQDEDKLEQVSSKNQTEKTETQEADSQKDKPSAS
jgi:hypothetical protein